MKKGCVSVRLRRQMRYRLVCIFKFNYKLFYTLLAFIAPVNADVNHCMHWAGKMNFFSWSSLNFAFIVTLSMYLSDQNTQQWLSYVMVEYIATHPKIQTLSFSTIQTENDI